VSSFDQLSHVAIMDRVRARVADKRVLGLVKAFLKAGIMSEHGDLEAQLTGAPQGALCAAAHKNPYEQRWVMRSVSLDRLQRRGLTVERCA
jgi:retron-type reverse transcriptase